MMYRLPPSINRRIVLAGAAALVMLSPAAAQETIKVGLVAAMSGQSAKSGEAITRGLSLAIDEINAKGGVLGKKLELVSRDDESNPAKGVVAARELVQREKVVALFGGEACVMPHPFELVEDGVLTFLLPVIEEHVLEQR